MSEAQFRASSEVDAQERYAQLRRAHPGLFESARCGIRVVPFDEIETRLLEQGMSPHELTWGVQYEDPYMIVVRDPVVFPSGAPGLYVRVIPKPLSGLGVVAIPRSGDRVLLVRHPRHATRREHWEFPRGFGDDRYTSIQNALRELNEETGLEAKNVTEFGTITPDAGMLASRVGVFCVDVADENISLDKNEATRAKWYPLHDLPRMISTGDIDDALTISAFALLHFTASSDAKDR